MDGATSDSVDACKRLQRNIWCDWVDAFCSTGLAGVFAAQETLIGCRENLQIRRRRFSCFL